MHGYGEYGRRMREAYRDRFSALNRRSLREGRMSTLNKRHAHSNQYDKDYNMVSNDFGDYYSDDEKRAGTRTYRKWRDQVGKESRPFIRDVNRELYNDLGGRLDDADDYDDLGEVGYALNDRKQRGQILSHFDADDVPDMWMQNYDRNGGRLEAYLQDSDDFAHDEDWDEDDDEELEESYRHQKPAHHFHESNDEAREVYRRCLKKAGADSVVGYQRAIAMLMEDILFDADPSTAKGVAIKNGDEEVWQSIADRVVDLFKNHMDLLRTTTQQDVVNMLLKESRQDRRRVRESSEGYKLPSFKTEDGDIIFAFDVDGQFSNDFIANGKSLFLHEFSGDEIVSWFADPRNDDEKASADAAQIVEDIKKCCKKSGVAGAFDELANHFQYEDSDDVEIMDSVYSEYDWHPDQYDTDGYTINDYGYGVVGPHEAVQNLRDSAEVIRKFIRG